MAGAVLVALAVAASTVTSPAHADTDDGPPPAPGDVTPPPAATPLDVEIGRPPQARVLHGRVAAAALQQAPDHVAAAVADNLDADVDQLIDELRHDPTLFITDDGMAGHVDTLSDEHHTDDHDSDDVGEHADDDHVGDRQHGDGHDGGADDTGTTGSPDVADLDIPTGVDVFALESRPSSPRTIYLDVDGHLLDGELWNTYYGLPATPLDAFDRNGDPTTFTIAEREEIYEIWLGVVDDFAPFDVNVTTVDPGTEALRRAGANDDEYGTRVVITGTNWRGSAGVAFLNVFASGHDVAAFAFSDVLRTGPRVAHAVSHEVGHTLGLGHDGYRTNDYYFGTSTWGPIMGGSGGSAVTQWSKGDYADATRFEDDLAVIGGQLLTVPDDHGGTIATATPVDPATGGTVAGLIGHEDDVDVIAIDDTGAPTQVTVRPGPGVTNLHVRLAARDDRGNTVTELSPTSRTNWSLATTLPAGRHTLELRAAAWQTVPNGWITYGSLGTYTVTLAPQGTTPTSSTSTTTSTTTTTAPPPPTSSTSTTTSTSTTSTTSTTTPSPTSTTSSTTTTTAPPGTTTTPPPVTSPPAPVPTTSPPPSTPSAPPTVARTPAGGRTRPIGSLSSFTPVDPFRFADSRRSLRSSPLRAGTVQRIQIGGVAGLPRSVTAVSANFTVVDPDRKGYLTAYDCTSQVPTVSTLNFVPGRAVANQAVIPLDDRGGLCLFSPATADIVIDVNGTFAAGATQRLTATDPHRALDTRRSRPVRPGETRRVRVEGSRAGVPAAATAVVVNLTAVRPAARGWVRAFPCDQRRAPTVSNVNVGAGQVVANSAVVKLSASGDICLQTNTVADVVVDVTGYLSATGMRFQAVAPVRLVDTRGIGRVRSALMPADHQTSIRVAGVGGLPSDARAVASNLVAVSPTGPGYVTAWPCSRPGEQPPVASNLNHPAGRNVANGATVGLADQDLCVYHRAGTHLVIDVFGIWR